MTYEELKKQVVITPKYIDVTRKFITKYQLSQWDIHELVRMIINIDHYAETTTINKRVAKLLMSCDVPLVPDGIGWKF